MGSWADLALPVSGIRASITATAAVAAATAGNDREHQHSNNKQKNHTEADNLHWLSLGQFLELKEKLLTNGLNFLQKTFRRHSVTTSPGFMLQENQTENKPFH